MLVLERAVSPAATASHHAERAPERPYHGGLALALMDQVACGLVACDADGRVLHANRAAWREFDSGRTLKVTDHVVRCASGPDADLAAALQDAATKQRSRLLWIGHHSDRLMVVAMPLASDGHVNGNTAPTAVLMIGRRSLCSPLGLEMFANRHSLTFAEQRVLAALIVGRSTREIAETHQVRLSTIRTQIQAVRDKLGVRSIDELLLRAAQIPLVTSRHELQAF